MLSILDVAHEMQMVGIMFFSLTEFTCTLALERILACASISGLLGIKKSRTPFKPPDFYLFLNNFINTDI